MTEQTVAMVPTTLFVRANRVDQDKYIINEVITEDTYRLRYMKQKGFEPQTVVSVGSHIGTFEVLSHALWPNARIISVEPNKETFELLKRNAPYSAAYNAAVSYKEQGILIDGELSSGGSFIATKEEFERIEGYDPSTRRAPEATRKDLFYHIADTNIRSITFEELVHTEGLIHIDLLKLDCEGGEWGIMEHLPMQGLEIGYVVGEWHGAGEYSGRDFNTFVKEAKRAFPHLTFHGLKGENPVPWGPFFSFPEPTSIISEQVHSHTPFRKRIKRWLRKKLS
jgi:FkbM family methyltransferase